MAWICDKTNLWIAGLASYTECIWIQLMRLEMAQWPECILLVLTPLKYVYHS